MSKRSREESDQELERRDDREDGTEEEQLQMKKSKSLGEAELVHSSEKASTMSASPTASWETLPAELRLRLFLFVGCAEVVRVCRLVSREWLALSDDETLWRAFYATHLGPLAAPPARVVRTRRGIGPWQVCAVQALRELARAQARNRKEIRKVTNQCAYDTFEWALSQGHDKVAISLVERDPAFVHGRYTRGITPLMKAVPTGRIPVIAALIQHGASVNAADSGGSTPLMAAACMALFDVVRFLLEQPGLNIDAVDLDGMSALHWAVWAVQPDIVQLLLDKGANPLLLTTRGETPLSLAKNPQVQALLQRLGTSQDQSPP